MVMVVDTIAAVDISRIVRDPIVSHLHIGVDAQAMKYRRCRYPGCHAMVALPDHYCKQHYDHEAEYLANRQRWARAHSKQYTHKYNTVTRNRNDAKSNQYQFYRSRQWQELRHQALDRDHYVCRYCGQPNSKTVDHIVPIEYDQSLMADVENLATICRRCHHLKTQWEESYYFVHRDEPNAKAVEIHDVNIVKDIIRKQ